MVALPSEFRATLESYRGPLDLLLYLIKKDEIDIFDIPIARVVGQYHAYLQILQGVDPNACGEFLVMAANLMEIKSKLLLPREELGDDEMLEDPRLELVYQLLEYKKYKERALLLERRFSEFQRRHDRPDEVLASVESDELEHLELGDVSVWDLLTAFHRIQIALGNRGPVRFVVCDRPMEEYVALIEESLVERDGRRARFDDLFVEGCTREDAIGLLLAILELAKERRLALEQLDPFGPIELYLRTDDEVRALRESELSEARAEVEPAAATLLRGEGPAALAEPIPNEVSEAPELRESSGSPEPSEH